MILLFILLSVIVVILGCDLLITYLKHNRYQKTLVLNEKVYAQLEDYGYKDHYLLKRLQKTFTTIIVVIVVIMLYISIIVILLQSLNSSSIVTSFEKLTFKWYGEIFKHRALKNAIINTFIISISATLISTILGTLIAVGVFYLPKKQKNRLLLLNNFPLLNADIVTGIGLMLIFSMLLPVLPYFFGWQSMLIAHLFFCLPYVVLSVLPKLKEIDPNTMDAALDLGMKPMKALWKIVIPSVKSGILSGALLAFTMSFDDFVVSYYTTGNGFDNLSIWIYGSIGRKSLTPAVYAFSSLITFGSMLVLFIAIFLINRKKESNVK